MEMAVVSMEMPSGGTSPSRRCAGTETSVPQILASRWRRLWKVSRTVAFFRLEDLGQGPLNRRRGGVGGSTRRRHSRGRGPPPGRTGLSSGAHRALLWWLSGVLEASWKNRIMCIDFIRFREYFLTRISETKNSRKQELALRHLVNRLVPENA